MWARKCGAPPRWPSRVKVIVFSFFSGTIGLSIYTYMAGSNISFLELDMPASEAVVCLSDWPSRDIALSWTTPVDLIKWWWSAGLDHKQRLEQHRCSVPALAETSCWDLMVPVRDMKRPLFLAMDKDSPNHYDVLGVWARLFLIITFLIWVGMTTHDLALVGRSKDYVLDVNGVNEHCPLIRRVWRSLVGLRVLSSGARTTLKSGWLQCWFGTVVGVVLAPLLLVWNLLVLNFVMCPLILLAFLRYPIRLSRAWTFIVCVVASVYGLVLSLEQLAYIASPRSRPQYAVTWEPPMAAYSAGNFSGSEPVEVCTCGCDYQVAVNVHVNLLIIGAATTMKSFFIAFRCLKGLRRSQWANLLSVTFAIPLTVYPVLWRKKDGKAIDFRSEDMPEPQGEVAFDPFAMMDEQLDSASTTVHLRPAPFSEERSDGLQREECAAPQQIAANLSSSVRGNMMYRKKEYIGCCGFPWATGGVQGVYDPVILERCESEATSSIPPTDLAGARPVGEARKGFAGLSLEEESNADSDRAVADDWFNPLSVAPEVGTPAAGPVAISEGSEGRDDPNGPDFPLTPEAGRMEKPRTLHSTGPVPQIGGDTFLPKSPGRCLVALDSV